MVGTIWNTGEMTMYIKFKKYCECITVGKAYVVEDVMIYEGFVKYFFYDDNNIESFVESTTMDDLFEVVTS